MRKFKVTRTYSMKTFTEQVEVEAETPEAASEAAAEALDAKDDEIESLGLYDLLNVQEEAEEVV